MWFGHFYCECVCNRIMFHSLESFFICFYQYSSDSNGPGWGGWGDDVCFGPRISESCGQYKFEPTQSSTGLPFQFLPGAFLFLPRSPEFRASHHFSALTVRAFVLFFLFLGWSMGRPLRNFPFIRVLAHGLQQGQSHTSLVPKLDMGTPTLPVGVYIQVRHATETSVQSTLLPKVLLLCLHMFITFAGE